MKKSRKPFLIVALIAFAAIDLLAQSNTPDSFSNISSIGTGTSMFRSFDNRYKGVKGSITLLEEYCPAKIVMEKGRIIRHDKVNYDAMNGDLLVLRNGLEAVANISMISSFVLAPDDADSLYFERMKGPDGKNGFYQRILLGKVGYYKKQIKKIIEPNNTGAYSAGRSYSELVPEAINYLLENGELKEFKNKKTFLQQLTFKNQEAEAFIKNEKLNFKEEGDLRRLFYFLNEEETVN